MPETPEWQSWGVSPGISIFTFNVARISSYGGDRICQVLGKTKGPLNYSLFINFSLFKDSFL